jgi:hypothetical protein
MKSGMSARCALCGGSNLTDLPRPSVQVAPPERVIGPLVMRRSSVRFRQAAPGKSIYFGTLFKASWNEAVIPRRRYAALAMGEEWSRRVRLRSCLVRRLPEAPDRTPIPALTWLTCGRTFPATQKSRFGVGRLDSVRLAAAIMLLIYGWRRGPERVSRHVQETMAARGNLAVAYEVAGDPGPAIPLMPG